MVRAQAVSYVRHMATKTIRLAHPELCDGCADLLPTGTAVLVDASLHVTCASCAGDVHGLAPLDPWCCISDPVLHDRLVHRHDADQRVLISA